MTAAKSFAGRMLRPQERPAVLIGALICYEFRGSPAFMARHLGVSTEALRSYVSGHDAEHITEIVNRYLATPICDWNPTATMPVERHQGVQDESDRGVSCPESKGKKSSRTSDVVAFRDAPLKPRKPGMERGTWGESRVGVRVHMGVGKLWLTHTAHQALGFPLFVRIAIDDDAHTLTITPAATKETDAVRVQSNRQVRVRKKLNRFAHWGWEPGPLYRGDVVDGVVIVRGEVAE